MSDRLLRELGDLARSQTKAEEARFDERWDRLAAGTLTAEEEAELKALADSSPEYREAYEAFRPLGAEFQARVVSAIQSKQAAERAAGDRQRETQKRPPPVPPFWQRMVRRPEVWAGFAAAVVVVFLLVPPPPVLTPLSDYTAEAKAQSEYRGSESRPAHPGSQVIVTLRPDTEVKPPLEARSFLSRAGTVDLRPWQSTPEIKGNGVVILRGALPKDIQAGLWTVWGIVARPDRMPPDPQAELRAGRTGNADWRAASTNLQIDP